MSAIILAVMHRPSTKLLDGQSTGILICTSRDGSQTSVCPSAETPVNIDSIVATARRDPNPYGARKAAANPGNILEAEGGLPVSATGEVVGEPLSSVALQVVEEMVKDPPSTLTDGISLAEMIFKEGDEADHTKKRKQLMSHEHSNYDCILLTMLNYNNIPSGAEM